MMASITTIRVVILMARRGDHLRAALRVEQPDYHRDVEWLLGTLPRRRRARLRQRERVDAGGGVVRAGRGEDRRARLRVPPLELGEVDAICIGHRCAEVVARDRGTVVALEVLGETPAEPVLADERHVHPDHLRALLVDRRRVKVVHRNVRLWPDRVRHRPGVLDELAAAHGLDILDANHGARPDVARELLVTEDGQSFLERELEPVAACDPVARPVVKVLVPDHALDALVVVIGGGGGLGERERRVEDVEPLVLHRAHVEVVDGDDVVQVQVIFEAEPLLVPLHRLDQRRQRVVALVHVFFLRVHVQLDPPPRRRLEGAAHLAEVPGHKREQVARLWVRVLPHRKVPAAAAVAVLQPVPVGEEDGVRLLARLEPHAAEGGHHVGPVVVVGDAAEALGLTLRAEHATRLVQAGQLQVGRRREANDRLEHKWRLASRQSRGINREDVAFDGVGAAAGRELDAVHRQRDELEVLAVEVEAGAGVGAGAARDVKARSDRSGARLGRLAVVQ
mmetsp:Transcript_18469/g.62128  ORF Transcript_18469/g.62128 Transcript_18469/m.62128 type:complete len:508 (-) Transcript_18469:241-1764(-)